FREDHRELDRAAAIRDWVAADLDPIEQDPRHLRLMDREPRVGDEADHGGAVLAKIEAVRAVPLDDAVGGRRKLFEKALNLGLEIAGDEIGPGATGRELAGEALDLGIELIGRRVGRDGGQRRGEADHQRRHVRPEPQPHFIAPCVLSSLALSLTIAELSDIPGKKGGRRKAASRLRGGCPCGQRVPQRSAWDRGCPTNIAKRLTAVADLAPRWNRRGQSAIRQKTLASLKGSA